MCLPSAFALSMASVLLYAAVEYLTIGSLIAKPLVDALVFVINFAVLSRFVFRWDREPEAEPVTYLYLAKQIGIAVAFGAWAYIVAKGLFARSSLRLNLHRGGGSPRAGRAFRGGDWAPVRAWPCGRPHRAGNPGRCGTCAGDRRLAVARASPCVEALEARYLQARSREMPVRLVMILIAGSVLIPVALNALTPPYMSDEVRYHLPYALHFVEQGRIVPDLYLRYPFHTLNVNLLYAAALIFGDDVTPHYIHLLLGCLAGLGVVRTCSGQVRARHRVLRSPAVLRHPDLSTIRADSVSSTSGSRFSSPRRSRVWTGLGKGPPSLFARVLAFGAALGTKYLALAFIAAGCSHGRRTARVTAGKSHGSQPSQCLPAHLGTSTTSSGPATPFHPSPANGSARGRGRPRTWPSRRGS